MNKYNIYNENHEYEDTLILTDEEARYKSMHGYVCELIY